jgi:hypothetical protein
MFFVSNLQSSSQAGRRRFESGLPLHLFNNLQGFRIPSIPSIEPQPKRDPGNGRMPAKPHSQVADSLADEWRSPA